STDKEAQYTYINAATSKGYNVLIMNGQLDPHFIGLLEGKLEKCRFVRVDSDVVDNLIRKEDKKDAAIDTLQRNIMTTLFKSQIPTLEKSEFIVAFEAMSPNDQPIIITQSEFMRRMKDMAAMQPGMNFYGELPDSYNLTLNTEHHIVKKVMDNAINAIGDEIKPLEAELDTVNKTITKLNDSKKDNKELSEDDKKLLSENESKAEEIRKNENEIITKYAVAQDTVKQLVDIALLGNNLLKGEALNNFLKRSISML
ncbi:MAG: molecular chaperone HtpG, partial [Muribaculaceae bacterium]